MVRDKEKGCYGAREGVAVGPLPLKKWPEMESTDKMRRQSSEHEEGETLKTLLAKKPNKTV